MNTLKFYRLQKKLTVKDLAEKVGISPSTYSYIEREEITASEDVADKIAGIFSIPKEDIFFPQRFGIRELKGFETNG